MTVRALHASTAELLRCVFRGQDASWSEQGELSEEAFFNDVRAEGMVPLLFRVISEKRCYADWPSALLTRLRETALRHAAVELVLEADLRQLLASLAAIKVTPLLLKGTPLSYTLYLEPGLRPRCDTDLLIPEGDRDKTAALMKRLGYAPLHEAQVDYINTQMSYSKKTAQGVSCCYDIHWQMSNCNRQFSRDFSDGRLYENSVAVPSLGENSRTLSKVDALIFSCFHRAGHFAHSGDRLIWLYDIHLLCQDLNREETTAFSQRAGELKIIALCADAITAARFWFGTVLSQELEALSRNNAEEASSALLLGTDRVDGIRRHALLELKGLSTWRERLSFLLQNLFPPAEYMLWRYHRKNRFSLPWLYIRRCSEGVYILFRK